MAHSTVFRAQILGTAICISVLAAANGYAGAVSDDVCSMGYEGTEQLLVRCENGKVIEAASEPIAGRAAGKRRPSSRFMSPHEVADRTSQQFAKTLFLDIRGMARVGPQTQ
jgi:hypothetical protein